jgi:hypothetical protein
MIYLTVHSICLDLRQEESDMWDLLARDYKEKYEKAFNNMTLEYDEDESGSIEGQEEMKRPSEIRIGRA